MRETIFDLVRRDLAQRDRMGWQQHGKPLLPHDGRDSLQEAYEEALDLAVYLRKAIAEREQPNFSKRIAQGASARGEVSETGQFSANYAHKAHARDVES